MIHFTTGNLFDSKADMLVNTVNCVGVAGKGVALECKRRFPAAVAQYAAECHTVGMEPGDCLLTPVTDGPMICHMATKNHWRNPSRLEWIASGLRGLRRLLFLITENGAKPYSVAMPAPGCGNGGLHWPDVKKLIVEILSDSTAEITVYEPIEAK